MKNEKPEYILYYYYRAIGRIVKTYCLIDINGRILLSTTNKYKVRITLDLLGLKNYKKTLHINSDMRFRKTYHSASIEYYER